MPSSKKTSKKTTPKYKVTFTTGGETYTIESTKIADLPKKMVELEIPTVKTNTVVDMEYNKQKSQRVYRVHQARRFFSNEVAAEITLNNLKTLLK